MIEVNPLGHIKTTVNVTRVEEFDEELTFNNKLGATLIFGNKLIFSKVSTLKRGFEGSPCLLSTNKFTRELCEFI